MSKQCLSHLVADLCNPLVSVFANIRKIGKTKKYIHFMRLSDSIFLKTYYLTHRSQGPWQGKGLLFKQCLVIN